MVQILSDDDVGPLQKKVEFFFLGIMVFFLLVICRLFYLQVLHGGYYRLLSDQISVREEILRAPRGLIVDRNGRVIADNRSYYEIAAIPQHIRDKKRLIQSVARLIPVSEDELQSRFDQERLMPPFLPVVLADDAPFDWIVRIRQVARPDYEGDVNYYLEGLEIRSTSLRLYLYPEMFSHVLGYLKEIDGKTLENFDRTHTGRYSYGDLLGASGVEGAYDLDLRGTNGMQARVVDARGREIRDDELRALQEKTSRSPVSGNKLVTTLDFDAQEAAFKALEGKRGSVVAIEPNTGEVLVLVSSPGFDGNRILKKVDREYWQKINLDPDKYLLNRAIQGLYPPGSTYKLVTGFAGLHTGAITPQTTFRCGGGMQFGNRFFRCWNKGGHGALAFVAGLSRSCDVYFYNVGLRAGVDAIKEHAHLLGLGEKTGIELSFEQAGLIPGSEWKMKRYKTPWIESETLSIAIGQGYDLTTPLQMARLVSMIANGGKPFTPHLGREIRDPNGEVIRKIESELGDPVIPSDELSLLQQGMINVVQGEGGTARRLASSIYKIAGKTGTSQVVGHDSGVAVTERRKPHGWFIAYAPYDDPKIALSVIVENGGSGSGAAAPVAREVIERYLGKH